MILLDKDNFSKRVVSAKEPAIVLFYAPYCTHTKAMAQEWYYLSRILEAPLRRMDCALTSGWIRR